MRAILALDPKAMNALTCTQEPENVDDLEAAIQLRPEILTTAERGELWEIDATDDVYWANMNSALSAPDSPVTARISRR